MKNKILFLILFVVTAVTVHCQTLTEGSMEFIENIRELQIVFDFDKAIVLEHNMSLDEYAKLYDEKEKDKPGTFMNDYKKKKRQLLLELLERAAEKLPYIRFSINEYLPYTMTCHLKDIEPSGKNANLDFIFTDNRSGQTLAVVNVKCRGGRIGSFSNLLGDSCEDAFGKIVKYMDKAYKGKL